MGKITIPQGFDPKIVKHWYLVANRAEARVYEGQLNGDFHFVKRFQNPRGVLSEVKLANDSVGRKKDVAAGFAKQLAQFLDKSAQEKIFTDLVILAEPHFAGLIQRKFSKRVKTMIRESLRNEWSQGSDEELQNFLMKKLA